MQAFDKHAVNMVILYIHKECARDSPVDHTATCMCKVLKAD